MVSLRNAAGSVALAVGIVIGTVGLSAGQAEAAPSIATSLDQLEVKGRAPKTGYERAQFGQAWSDDVRVAGGHNGCDTRNDILRRDLYAVVIKPGTNGCVVAAGLLDDPYTATTIPFVRGSNSSAVQIDHVVALSDAWQKGAQQWTASKRRDFANDPRNLLAVDGPTNLRKGSGDAATWLPPNKSFRCEYVSKQIRVKRLYGLWVTQAEKSAMRRVLASCGLATPEAAPSTPQARSTPTPSGVYYRNCAQARAAGAAPIRRGEPGYRAGLDGDNDGVACERG